MPIALALLLVLADPTLALSGLDPIELAAGREVEGKATLTASYGRYEYRFASEKNRKVFTANPAEHGIQWGGACGSMGPLTGKGDPERWTVADGKIWIFASEQCRDTFLANREAYLAPIPKMAVPAADAKARGLRRFRNLVAAHGGQSALDKVRSASWTYETNYGTAQSPKILKEDLDWIWPDRYASGSTWNGNTSFFAVRGDEGSEGTAEEHFSMHPVERDALVRDLRRTPLLLLRGGAQSVLGETAPTELDGKAYDSLAMAWRGIESVIALDPTTGRIHAVSFRDRFAGRIRDVCIRYADYRQRSGVWLPMTSTSRVDGGNWGAPKTIHTLKLNPQPSDLFEQAFGTG
jgi:YHS domain-containing protein